MAFAADPATSMAAGTGVSRSLPVTRQVAAALLAVAIFWADTFTDFGSAFATLYVLVLLLACNRAARAHIFGWSAVCALFTVASFAFVHGMTAHADATLRMVISLGANAVTTGLLLHRQAVDDRATRGERRHEDTLNSLAVAIWEHDFRPVAAAIAAVRAAGVEDLPAFLDENPDFIVSARSLVRITDVNETALDLMGVPSKQAFFEHLSDFLPESDASFRECILAIDERRDMFQAETQVRAANGEPIDIFVAFSLSPDRGLDRVPGSIFDIRQRKRLEMTVERTRSELDKVQRSAALGAMSAMIAHEINQPLTAVQGFAFSAQRWIERDVPDLDEARQALAGLHDAVLNVHEVMQRVRNLVGNSQTENAPVNLHTLIRNTVSFASRDVEAQGARISFSHCAPDVMILGDRVLLKHLLLNLIANALQAMEIPSREEKLIEIDLSLAGNQASIIVRDTGPGLPASTREKLFEPFFTTKPVGMGLGLSICRSIVELHDGQITLANHPEGGTRVSLTLPARV